MQQNSVDNFSRDRQIDVFTIVIFIVTPIIVDGIQMSDDS